MKLFFFIYIVVFMFFYVRVDNYWGKIFFLLVYRCYLRDVCIKVRNFIYKIGIKKDVCCYN